MTLFSCVYFFFIRGNKRFVWDVELLQWADPAQLRRNAGRLLGPPITGGELQQPAVARSSGTTRVTRGTSETDTDTLTTHNYIPVAQATPALQRTHDVCMSLLFSRTILHSLSPLRMPMGVFPPCLPSTATPRLSPPLAPSALQVRLPISHPTVHNTPTQQPPDSCLSHRVFNRILFCVGEASGNMGNPSGGSQTGDALGKALASVSISCLRSVNRHRLLVLYSQPFSHGQTRLESQSGTPVLASLATVVTQSETDIVSQRQATVAPTLSRTQTEGLSLLAADW